MAVKLTQSLRQSQTLMMTPQLQQAIKLLTLTHMEMTNVIAQEMVENPMLEEIGGDNTASQEDYGSENLEIQNQEAKSDSFEETPIIARENDDFDWQSYIESQNPNNHQPPSMATKNLDELPNYENIISKGQSLADHLEWQIRMENLSDDELNVALLVIGNINDDGYMATNFEEIISESGVDREISLRILDKVQRLDPIGCGARDLTDCLLAQAKIMEERSPLLEKIIRDHLPDLHVKDYLKIGKALGVTSEKVEETSLLLQLFHPKPGRLIASPETLYVVPDIYVKEVSGKFEVQVNDEGVPRLRVSQLYKEMMTASSNQSPMDKEAKDYVEEKLRSAVWLIKSIQNRQRTIVRVAQAIVEKQQEFFQKGPKFLKPMVLRDIATEIEMHESTVSRVTTNKYMHTPIGVFELKYFFNSGIGGNRSGSGDISSEVLKMKVKELVDNENPKRPLSDQKIVELLEREDLKVARRTIAKYREALGILSSSKRKLKT